MEINNNKKRNELLVLNFFFIDVNLPISNMNKVYLDQSWSKMSASLNHLLVVHA